MGFVWECWEEWVQVNLKSSLAATHSRKSLGSPLASRGGSATKKVPRAQESRQLHRLPNIYLNTLPTCITHLMTGTWESLVYGSRCSGNHNRHSKLVDTGISHSLQQQLFLDNVLKKRNTNDKNVRIFSSISYAGPCTTVNSGFKLPTHLQSDSPEKSPSLRFHFKQPLVMQKSNLNTKKTDLKYCFSDKRDPRNM